MLSSFREVNIVIFFFILLANLQKISASKEVEHFSCRFGSKLAWGTLARVCVLLVLYLLVDNYAIYQEAFWFLAWMILEEFKSRASSNFNWNWTILENKDQNPSLCYDLFYAAMSGASAKTPLKDNAMWAWLEFVLPLRGALKSSAWMFTFY